MARTPILPSVFKTVGAMIDGDIEIYMNCRAAGCGQAFKVDLHAIARLRGRDYSLLGVHPPCRILNCEGRCGFMVSAGRATPMVTLDRWVPD